MGSYQTLFPFLALIGPFFIWPIEQILPYPYLVEELFKALAILFLPLKQLERNTAIKLAVVFGFLFAFSESVFYFINILSTGSPENLFLRNVFTMPLHVLTTLVLMLAAKKGLKTLIAGLGVAILIHYFFNLVVDQR